MRFKAFEQANKIISEKMKQVEDIWDATLIKLDKVEHDILREAQLNSVEKVVSLNKYNELLNRVKELEEENKKLKIDSICYTWLYEHGRHYTEAFPSPSASYNSSRGPYIEMQLPSITQTVYYPTKEHGTQIILKAIKDKVEQNNKNFAVCKKCNVNRLESANCFYPHACGFSGVAYMENPLKDLE
jgi:hypothetical protein